MLPVLPERESGSSLVCLYVHAVVGLDPAGPLFSLDDPSNRFDHTDATYVESIITDGGRLGFEHPVGHANFYPSELSQCSVVRYSQFFINYN